MSKYTVLLLVIGLFLFLFSSMLASYFSQDDFFHLRVIMDKGWGDIPSFFISRPAEYAFFRPLSRETFNMLMYKIFGLNPFPFHMVNLLLIVGISALLFSLLKKITDNFIIACLAVFLYLVSAVHSVELYYLASVQTLLSTFFLMSSVLVYLSWAYLLSFLFFILALLSHETAVVLPAILLLLEVIINKKRFFPEKKVILRLVPFAAVAVVALVGAFLFSHLPVQQVYRPVISLKSMFNSLGWYTAWSFGLSEMVIDFIGPGFTVNPVLMKYYSGYIKVVLPLIFFATAVLIFLIYRFRRECVKDKLDFIFGLSFVIALLPFLFFPQHKSTYYLSFASVWFSAFLAAFLSYAWNTKKAMRVLSVLFLVAFLGISYQTIELNKLTYWAAKRGKAAQFLLDNIRQSYPIPGPGAVFYIKDDPEYPFIAREWGSSSKQAFYIMSGSDALKLIYHDPTIKVYFEGTGQQIPLSEQEKMLTFTAKFPF